MFLDSVRTLLNHLRQRHLASILSDVFVVVVQYKFVGIDTCDAALNALCQDIWRELIGAVQDNLHLATGLVVDALQSGRALVQPLTSPFDDVIPRIEKEIARTHLS